MSTGSRIGVIAFAMFFVAFGIAAIYRTQRPRRWRDSLGNWRPPAGNLFSPKGSIRAGYFGLGLAAILVIRALTAR